MSDLVKMVAQQLGEGGISKIAGQLGASEAQTGSAIQAALPMLIGQIASNAQQPEGAQALAGALAKDHDGSILDNVGSFLGQGDTSPGEAILGHVLGGKRSVAQNGLAKVSGLDGAQSGQLMAMLAPVVMGALGKQKQEGGLDVGALASMLGGQRAQIEDNPVMSAATKFLDSDGDGSVLDDLATKLGGSGGLLGKLF